MAGIRSTALETERRVFTIQGWIINGIPEYLILKNIQTQFKDKAGEGLSRKQAKRLLKKAYDVWVKEEEATVDQKRIMRIAELKQDIRGMKEIYKGTPQGMAVVNAIKKEISKLEALYPHRQMVIRGDRENPIVVDSKTREERIAELMAKAAADPRLASLIKSDFLTRK